MRFWISENQNRKVVQHISFPKPMGFAACKGNLSKMKDKLMALEVLQDPEDSA
jgi:hypothetical protein